MAEAERWRFPPESDLVGTWLASALVGKQRRYLVHPETGEPFVGPPEAPGVYEVKTDSNSGTGLFPEDVYEIKVHWDQWVRVTLECSHGSYVGESEFFNVTEALVRAAQRFNEADHPVVGLVEEGSDTDG